MIRKVVQTILKKTVQHKF